MWICGHFSYEKCALLSYELTTLRQAPCTTTHPFVAQRSIVYCARKSAPLQNSEPPSNDSKKTLRTSQTSRELKQMPRAAAKGLAALPILPYHSKLELNNSIHKSAHIRTYQFVKICDDLWTKCALPSAACLLLRPCRLFACALISPFCRCFTD